MADVMLAEKWSDEDPSGWWVSEKLDGVRAVWKGGKFVSRGDNTFACPDWFAKKMPAGCILDGELWGGRRQFQKTVGIVKSTGRAKEWEFLTYMVFDVLVEENASVDHRPFEDRLAAIRRVCAGCADILKPVPMQRCRNRDHLQELLTDIEARGGEGLMLRRPGSLYERRRSKSLLKVKTFHDEEAIVVGHDSGKGRLASVCGALLCETPDKRRFKVGSGLSDAQRRDPPKVGAVITYRYQELTAGNIPRFPTLAGERVDLNWRHICSTYVPPAKRIDIALKKKHSVLFGEAEGSTPSSSSSAAPAGRESASAASSSSGLAASSMAPPPARAMKRALSEADLAQRAVPVEDMEDFSMLLCSTDEPKSEAMPPPAKRLKETPVDKRPICAYGSKCYRRNPDHFVEFAHPWQDAENEEPICIKSTDEESSLPPPPVVPPVPSSVVTTAEAEVARVDLAAAPAEPRDRPAGSSESMDVRVVALRSLLQSLVKDSAAEAQRLHFQHVLDSLNSGPCGEDMAATSSGIRESEPLPPFPPPDHPPPWASSTTKESTAAAVAETLEIDITAGISASSSSAAPTVISEPAARRAVPPVPEISPALSSADRIRAERFDVAAALLASSSDIRLPDPLSRSSDAAAPAEPPATQMASAEDVAAALGAAAPAGASAAPSPPPGVEKIMELGFSHVQATEALAEKPSIEEAIEWLLSRSG